MFYMCNKCLRMCIFFGGGFVYTGLGARSVASLGVGVLGCGDTPVRDRFVG